MSEFDPIAYINEPRWQESRLGLDRIVDLLERMGRPQDRLSFIHVAGTNGKGSTCAYLANVMQAAGFRTGLFTSPYIFEFEERIRVDGENISKHDLADVTLFVRDHAEAAFAETGEHPTEFELMSAVAFEHFARSRCDIVVCEVGLGGRLDSTNVIENPEACVITRIGLDHTSLLGNTPSAIAVEKAGIVKPGAAVVSWPQDDGEAMLVIEHACAGNGCSLCVPDFVQLQVEPVDASARRPFRYKGRAFETQLLASYQPFNAVLAIETIEAMRMRGWAVTEAALSKGISATVWPGRFEVAESAPVPLIIDGGHNPQGAAALADSLRDVFPGKRVTFLMGVLADKDYEAMITEVASLANAFVCATPPNSRALSVGDLAQALKAQIDDDVEVVAARDYREAIEKARQLAESDGLICVFGSLYAIAEIRQALAAS